MNQQARELNILATGRFQRFFIMQTTLLDCCCTGATLAQMLFLSRIIAGVVFERQRFAQVFPLLLLLLAAIGVRAGLVWLREIVVQRGASCFKMTTRQRVFAHLLQLGPAYSKGEATGELVTLLYEGVERLEVYVGRYLPQLSASVIVPLLIAAAIFPLDWVSGVLLLVTGPLIPVLMMLVGSFAEKRIARQISSK